MNSNRHGKIFRYNGRRLVALLYFRSRCRSVLRTRHGTAYTVVLALTLVACISVGVLVVRSTKENDVGKGSVLLKLFRPNLFHFQLSSRKRAQTMGSKVAYVSVVCRERSVMIARSFRNTDLALKSGMYHSSSKPESVEHVYLYIRASRFGGLYRSLQRMRFPVARYAKLPLGTLLHVTLKKKGCI